MRREIIQCEICEQEHDAQYELPKEWITTKQTGYPGNDIEQHFCSKTCLAKWTGIIGPQPHTDAIQTKMRRFLLVHGETAEITEGIQWSDGKVDINYGSPHSAWSNWERFKAGNEGSGVQWIDREVASQDKGHPGYHPPHSTHPPMSITGLRGDKPLEIHVHQEVSDGQ